MGDLATRSIDQLSCLVDEIFVPLLSNTENHIGWPEMVAQDVLKHTHSLKSTVYQVIFFTIEDLTSNFKIKIKGARTSFWQNNPSDACRRRKMHNYSTGTDRKSRRLCR